MEVLAAQILANCSAIAPELVLIAAVVAVILSDALVFSPRSTGSTAWLAMGGLACAFVLLMKYEPMPNESIFSGALRLDSLALFFQKIIALGALAICLFSTACREIAGRRQGEYYALILCATLGAMFLAAANDFVILVLALETLSLSSYVLAGYLRTDRQSAEAAIKYVLYGAIASSVMIFGLSYLYGLSGSLRISEAFAALNGAATPWAFMAAFAMVLCGLGFKISAAPFHNWTPDVYQGAPTPITAFLAVVSKSAGFAILIRFLLQAGAANGALDLEAVSSRLTGAGVDILFWVLAAATMTIGNLVAIRQTDIKRLLGYSSIAHAGYLLMVFTVLTPAAWDAALFYFIVYYLMTLGAFYVVIVLESQVGGCEMRACRGLWVASPYMVAAMVIFLVSLTGLPPTAGFIGKLKLFKVMVDAGLGEGVRGSWFYFSLALIGALNSVVSLYYYFKIVKAMTLEDFQTVPTVRLSALDLGVMGALMAAVVVFGIYFTPILRFVPAFVGPAATALTGF